MNLFLNSIRGRVFSWYFISAAALLFIICGGIYIKVEKTLDLSVDETLHSKMQVLLGLLHEEDGKVEMELSQMVYGEYSVPRSGHYYKLIINGKYIYFSQSLVSRDFKFIPSKILPIDKTKGEQIFIAPGSDREICRVLHKKALIFGIPVEIFVAESMENSQKILKDLFWFLILIIPAFIISFALIAYIIARHSLLPLQKFSEEVDRISNLNLNKRINIEKQVQELNSLSISFNNMLDRLDKAFCLEKLIISEASHQLKTPVTVIKSHCDITLQKKRSPEEYIETLNIIKTVSQNMAKLINKLLSLARLDAGVMNQNNFGQVSLDDCVVNAISLVQQEADKRNIIIKSHLEPNIKIAGDGDKLTEAILNIIDNAVKYNNDNGLVEIKLFMQDNLPTLIIKDNGKSIKEEDLSKIFERFYRSEVSDVEGTGLGLSISKSVIEAHGGNILVESKPGKGVTFTVIFKVNN